MKTYHAEVTYDSGMWAAVVHGLPPNTIGATDVEHFADLGGEVRDLIAALTGTDPDSFDITWQFIIDGIDVTNTIMEFTRAEEAYREAADHREEARVHVLEALYEHVPYTAIGDVIGRSHQRVGQLAASRR